MRLKEFLLIVAFFVSADAQVKVKGHSLGENPGQFLAADSHIQSEVKECHTAEQHQITADQVKAMSRKEEIALAESLPGWNSPKKVEKMAEEGKLWTPDKRFPAQKVWCDSVVPILELGKDGPFQDAPNFGDEAIHYTSFYFEGGKLSLIRVDLTGHDYDVALKDFSERAGANPVVDHPAMQNAMGAQWLDNIATWTTDSWAATLNEGRNPANPSLSLTLETKVLWNRQAEAYAHRKSGLDP